VQRYRGQLLILYYLYQISPSVVGSLHNICYLYLFCEFTHTPGPPTQSRMVIAARQWPQWLWRRQPFRLVRALRAIVFFYIDIVCVIAVNCIYWISNVFCASAASCSSAVRNVCRFCIFVRCRKPLSIIDVIVCTYGRFVNGRIRVSISCHVARLSTATTVREILDINYHIINTTRIGGEYDGDTSRQPCM